jgi:two-component system, sensor histidine kinase and response regulator
MEFISGQVEDITGYPASDFINNAVRSFASIMSQDDIMRVYNEAAVCLEQMKPFAVKYKIKHKDGTLRWVSHRGRGVFSHEGALLWFDGVLFDITDQMTFFGIAENKDPG